MSQIEYIFHLQKGEIFMINGFAKVLTYPLDYAEKYFHETVDEFEQEILQRAQYTEVENLEAWMGNYNYSFQ